MTEQFDIICPHCGHNCSEMDVAYDWAIDMREKSAFCGECDEVFKIKMHVMFAFKCEK